MPLQSAKEAQHGVLRDRDKAQLKNHLHRYHAKPSGYTYLLTCIEAIRTFLTDPRYCDFVQEEEVAEDRNEPDKQQSLQPPYDVLVPLCTQKCRVCRAEDQRYFPSVHFFQPAHFSNSLFDADDYWNGSTENCDIRQPHNRIERSIWPHMHLAIPLEGYHLEQGNNGQNVHESEGVIEEVD